MFHGNRSVKSREVALHRAVARIENVINHKRIPLGTFPVGLCMSGKCQGSCKALETWKTWNIGSLVGGRDTRSLLLHDPHERELRKFFDKNLLISVTERLTDRCHLRKHLYTLGSFVPPETGVEALTKRPFVLGAVVAPLKYSGSLIKSLSVN